MVPVPLRVSWPQTTGRRRRGDEEGEGEGDREEGDRLNCTEPGDERGSERR